MDSAYLNHKTNQQEIQIQALDRQLFRSQQARAELETRLAESDDDTDTQSSRTCDADEIGAQGELSFLQARYGERVEENQRILQDINFLQGHIKALQENVRKGRCKVH